MEGVGARLGRSSTRYGPATVFHGPVRKWKKRWIHVAPSNTKNNNNNSNHNQHQHNNKSNGTTATNTNNGNNGSHLLLYKWTPASQSNSNSNNNSSDNGVDGDKDSAKEDSVAAQEELPKRKFKYIPIALLEPQTKEVEENEDAEKVDDETKPIDIDQTMVESTPKSDDADEKPDINDTPMDETQEDNQGVRQDLNETLDLSLGLTAHDDDSGNAS